MRYKPHTDTLSALAHKAAVDPNDPEALAKVCGKAGVDPNDPEALGKVCHVFGVPAVAELPPVPELPPSCAAGDSPEAMQPCAQEGAAAAQASKAAALDAELVTQQEREAAELARYTADLDAVREQERAEVKEKHTLAREELAELHAKLGMLRTVLEETQTRMQNLAGLLS